MILRSDRMKTSRNIWKNHNNNNNNNKNNSNATNSSNNNNNNEKIQPVPYTGINSEVVMAMSQPNNDVICAIGQNMMCSQVYTSAVETTLPQRNMIKNTNTPPVSITRPYVCHHSACYATHYG